MKRITVQMLKEHKACEDQVKTFGQLFPHGAAVTLRNVLRAVAAGLDIDWAAQHLLSPTAWETYEAARAPAWKTYEAARASAFVTVWAADHPEEG